MHFKKIISVWAILALAFAQIAIAQHNAVHLGHGFQSIQVGQQANIDHERDNEDTPPSHECPECLLVKSLQTAFHADSALTVDFTLGQNLFSPDDSSFIPSTVASAYNPRAPPVLLI